jgi:sterol 3beta-glucosyltransferase
MLTWGSHGDVVPFVALAEALIGEGCDVTLGAQPMHGTFVRRYGIDFCSIGSDVTVEQSDKLIDHILREPNPRKQTRLLLHEALLPDLNRQYADCLAVASQADMVVVHWMQIAGMMAAETLGKPRCTVALNPVGIAWLPGRVAASDVTVARTQPCNAAASYVGRSLADFVWGDGLHQFRNRVGLPRISSVSEFQYSSELTLLSVGRCVLPEYESWDSRCMVAGFWTIRAEPEWAAPGPLEDFLSVGPKPVVVTFGSTRGRGRDTIEVVLEAIRRNHSRAVIQGSWEGMSDTVLPSSVMVVNHVPHEYLFARAAIVVHHGSAGTTAMALRMGVPSIVVWHMFDQPYWGNRLFNLGAGPRPLP